MENFSDRPISKPIKVKAMCVIKRDDGGILASLGYDKIKDEHFARIIGGHVEFGETAEAALRREFKEELGTGITNLSFIRMIENIFTYNGESYHEVVFLYSGELENKDLYEQENIRILDDPKVEVRWIRPADIESGKIKLYPEYDYASLS